MQGSSTTWAIDVDNVWLTNMILLTWLKSKIGVEGLRYRCFRYQIV